jgi:hypothetical protein
MVERSWRMSTRRQPAGEFDGEHRTGTGRFTLGEPRRGDGEDADAEAGNRRQESLAQHVPLS